MQCQHCGATLRRSDKTCPQCHRRVTRARRRCPACGTSVAPTATVCEMCYTPLRPARPVGWVRLAEIAGGVVLIIVVIAAVVILRGRTDTLALFPSGVTGASVATPASLGQLALGGTATSFPTLTPTTPPPTRTLPPPVTQAPPTAVPTQEVIPPTITPLPQTGGPPESPETTYIIRPGDSLLAIAIRHNITLEQLMAANEIANVNQLILPGQTLKIPKADTGEPPAAPQPAAQAPAPPPAAPPPSSEPPAPAAPQIIGRVTHIIRAGDSLWILANRYGKTVDELVGLNGFNSPTQILGIGAELVIEPGVTATAPPPTDTPVPPTATPVPPTDTPVPPTATPQPSATPEPTVTPEPTRQMVLAPSLEVTVASPALTATPITLAKYTAPTLLGVPDKSGVQGKVSTLLNWTSVGVLAVDEYYVVRVSTVKDGRPVTEEAWVKATGWRLPESLQPSEKATAPLVYTWEVTVHRATGRTAEGKLTGPAISPPSQVFEFTWTP